MIDVLSAVHLCTALMALLVTGLMTAGFLRLAWNACGLVGHLATGVLMIHFAVFLRTLYRDVLPLVFEPDARIFSPALYLVGTLALNVLIVLAGWHGLKALHLAIPESVRGRYSLLTAALYPPFRRR